MDCSLPGSFVHEILYTRLVEWVAMFSSRGSSQPRDQTRIYCGSCTAGRFFTTEPRGKPICVCVYIYQYTHISHFLYPFICLHVLAIVNSAAMNTGVHVSFQTRVFISPDMCPGMGILDQMVTLFLEPPYCFP